MSAEHMGLGRYTLEADTAGSGPADPAFRAERCELLGVDGGRHPPAGDAHFGVRVGPRGRDRDAAAHLPAQYVGSVGDSRRGFARQRQRRGLRAATSSGPSLPALDVVREDDLAAFFSPGRPKAGHRARTCEVAVAILEVRTLHCPTHGHTSTQNLEKPMKRTTIPSPSFCALRRFGEWAGRESNPQSFRGWFTAT